MTVARNAILQVDPLHPQARGKFKAALRAPFFAPE